MPKGENGEAEPRMPIAGVDSIIRHSKFVHRQCFSLAFCLAVLSPIGLGQDTHKLLTTVPLDFVPIACSADAGNSKLIITTGDGQVIFYDLKQARVTSRLRVDGSPLMIHRLEGDRLGLVGHWNGSKISLLDLFGGRLMRSIAVGDGPTYFARYGEGILVLLARARQIAFLNRYTYHPGKRLLFEEPVSGLAAAPGRRLAYVAVAMRKIAVVDLASRRLLHEFNMMTARETPLLVDPGERRLFAFGPRNTLLRISLDGETESGRISLGAGPVGLVMDHEGKYLYVSNGLEGTVSVVDAESLTEMGKVSVGSRPSFMAVSRDGRYVFVCNRGAKSISILERTIGG
jgi:YVTN family beta-propeller protein